jgi:hypothetical protein
MVDGALLTWVLVWVAGAAVVLVRHWRPGTGVGLVIAYVLSFAALHWFAPLVFLLPWYWTRALSVTTEGLRMSAIGMVAFAAGAELTAFVLRNRAAMKPAAGRPLGVEPQVVNLYLISGVLMYAVVGPIAGDIPTVSTLVSTGSTLTVVALALKYWNASTLGDRRSAARWLILTAAFPVVTVLVQGFLGYGFVAMLSVFAFVASQYRLRLRHVAAGLVMTYLGLSVYVTYMRDRVEIRDVVWSDASFEQRTNRLATTIVNAEWFNPYDLDQLDRIEQRLNQDFLVGAAVKYMEQTHSVTFARGETFWMALVALVPRAFWPGKPVVAGSGHLVSHYTGIRFEEGTSVGIGQVMECYVNFGTAGVIVGFFVIGALIVWLDRSAARALYSGNVKSFLLWYLPGLSFLQIGGAISEVTSTAAAAFVVALVLNFSTTVWLLPRHGRPVSPLLTTDPNDLGGRVSR